ncbi:MAG: hypothetical protein EAZ39_12110 [Oscillatoriales cyanobacterium]|uniref:hypothetical protein n=1 Tax=unclassified Microcoleus TaxID=2642155 RepID=UPI001D2E6FB2|nr:MULTISPECIES: hypothetical protein [unclassified Microcoleus]MCC3440029.1 hypothetical protein [Microcoleus sp. PH2017_05_CCC_O_A]MCC3588716.1 hypothetical protein [Microcoleus sp. PH2017_30_WIL_O_A]TAE62178.1 MAG: hypothetical protein EAZ86_31750 [Oscillatoriales cyanobacterium]TAG18086.1 MAG: hypothetical protein EAZ39_12110 [Oscillatoriales cyanobacterium]
MIKKGAIITSVILTLFQLSSCSIATSTKVSEPETQASQMPVDLEEVQSFTRIILPKSYRDLHVDDDKERGRLISVRFTMNRIELDKFLTEAGYEGKAKLNDGRELGTAHLAWKRWWTPDNAKNYLSGIIREDNSGKVWQSQILVDLVSEKTVIVYLRVLGVYGS